MLSCIFNMVYTCCVPHCKTGYRSHKANKKIQLFKFPIDVVLHRKWMSAIPRQDWTVNNSHRVCANHFYRNDFQTTTTNCRKVKKEHWYRGQGKVGKNTSEANCCSISLSWVTTIFWQQNHSLSKSTNHWRLLMLWRRHH